MESEFKLFIKEKRYVQNVAENTVEYYERSFKALKKHSDIREVSDISKISLLEFVSHMREKGMSAGAANAYIRGVNGILTWLFENELTPEHFKIKKLKCEKKVLKTFTDSQVKAMVGFKPKNVYEKRLHVMILTMLDTGVRIDEALTLRWSDVDFENMLMTVTGKGNKQRIIPVSIVLRKHLYNFRKSSKTELVFATKDGGKLMYDNMRRNLLALADKLGIDGFEGSFHALRRCFASNFIKNGGNPFILQRIMGHSSLKQTNEYVQLVTEDLSKEHHKTSILSNLR